MPRVPTYQPNQVAPVQTTGARFRAADNDGGVGAAIGKGLQQLGGAVSDYAEAQDRLHAENDDTQARLITAKYGPQFSAATTEFTTLQAGAARAGQPAYNKRLDDAYTSALDEAVNPRMKRFVEERLSGIKASAMDRIAGHAIVEAKQERSTAFTSQADSYAEMAAGTADPVERTKLIDSGIHVIRQKLYDIDGLDPEVVPDFYHQQELDYTSKVHGAVLDQMFAQADPDLAGVAGYVDAHGDQMTGALKTEVMKRMQGPIQDRLAQSDSASILSVYGGAKPTEASGGTTGYIDRVRAQESGGSNTARNPRSSATGQFQFTDATWLGTYKARYGEGGLSDRQILAKRSDAAIQETLMGDLTRKNGNALENAGLPVDGGTLYLAHFAGSGGATKALKADRDASVQDVLGSGVTKANPFLRTWNVGQLVDWAAGVGGGGRVANGPQEYDHVKLNEAVDKWAAATGASPERVERAKRQLQSHVNMDEGLLKDQQSQADTAAANLVATQGDGFRVAAVPRNVWNNLSPVQQAQYRDVEKKLTAPKEIKAGGEAAMTLKIMERFEPDKFKTVDMKQYAGQMTPSEYMDNWTKQQDMVRKPPAKFQPQEAISGAISRGQKYFSVDVKKEDLPAVYDFMDDWLKARQAKNGSIGPNDADEAFKAATSVAIKRPGLIYGSNERRGFEVKIDDIGDGLKDTIRRNWKGSSPPSDDEILDVYRGMVPAKGL